MKNTLALLAGAALILSALILAMSTSSQSQTPQPEVALVFATRLHMSPTPLLTQTPTATATETLPPTATPIVGWVKVETAGIQLWLPPDYFWINPPGPGTGPTPDPAAIRQLLSQGGTSGVLVFVARESNNTGRVLAWNIEVVEMKSAVQQTSVPFEIGTNLTIVSGPEHVSLGRYDASRMVMDAPLISGEHIRNLLYWFTRGNGSWLVIYTSLANEFEARLPLFETSARSFSILRDP